MDFFKDTYTLIKKKPFLAIYPSAVILLLLVINLFNPVPTLIKGLFSTFKGDFISSYIAILNEFITLAIIPYIIIGIIVVSAVAALACSLLCPGYLYVFNDAVTNKRMSKKIFFKGTIKYFSRFFVYIFFSILSFFLIIMVLAVAAVPAVLMSKTSLMESSGLKISAIFVDVITGIILIFTLLFYLTYVLYWFPAVYSFKKKIWAKSRTVINEYFWGIVYKIVLFGLLFAAIEYLISQIDITLVSLILNWMFISVFYIYFTSYLFYSFKRCKNRFIKEREG